MGVVAVPGRNPGSAGLNWDSLERLYSIRKVVKQFPALLHLIRPGAELEAVGNGRKMATQGERKC